MRVVGMISGTSMDGIDIAAADFQLESDRVEMAPLGTMAVPYHPDLRSDLEAALPPSATTAETICRLDNEVGRAFAQAATRALDLEGRGAHLVVSHGQTLYHWIEQGRARGTLQIGQPAWIAEATGLPVVADLRTADVAAGGQGAPLAAIFDVLLLGGRDRVCAALNLGGIANVTVVGPGAGPIAFDTGPGNTLIDAAVRHLTGEAFDRQGGMARRGTIHQPLLNHLLSESYYRALPPKTTGRELFHLPYLLKAVADAGPVGPEDLVATVTALTARTVADACRGLGVEEVIVSGGGAENPFLLELLSAELTGTTVQTIDGLGVPAAFKEAYFIALIGFLTINGLPGNVPAATGARRPAILGSIATGPTVPEWPAPAKVIPRTLQIVDRAQR
ncbi:MAG TPA: anhydro-N-acetylmuramic acid kinase [Acidimicrobiia bacterium]|nr:anhydro-N-acetylmuramic acid kinase [Acidimicrobiia bacterium]